MTTRTARTHVVLPADLLEAVERTAGPRGRSAFIAEAVREKLQRNRQLEALRATAGVLDPDKYPEWSTPEKISEWVHQQRYGNCEAGAQDPAVSKTA